MATANALYAALAAALAKTESSVEAYGLALRKVGWWSPTKRGRGATPVTANEAGKLLLALLIGEPSDLRGSFLDYANLRLDPAEWPRSQAIRDRLGLGLDAGFLDYIYALSRLFIDGRAGEVIADPGDVAGLVDDDYGGPRLAVRIKGPAPMAVIHFRPADRALANVGKQVILIFSHPFRAQMADARAAGDDVSASAFAAALEDIERATARGIRFERALGGREFAAVRDAFAADREASA